MARASVDRVRDRVKGMSIMKKKVVLAWSVAAISLTGIAFAQPSATVTLRSGERLSAHIVDLGGSGYTVRVDGQERQIGTNDVAAIDFTGGSVSNADWDKLSGGGQLLMLKNGETITGQLLDVGGTSPLRLTFRTSSGEREFSSNDVARIVMARPDNARADNAGATGSQHRRREHLVHRYAGRDRLLEAAVDAHRNRRAARRLGDVQHHR